MKLSTRQDTGFRLWLQDVMEAATESDMLALEEAIDRRMPVSIGTQLLRMWDDYEELCKQRREQ